MPGHLSIEITYGYYLSDHSILDGIDTELVVLSGIMMQNAKRETGWHLRGIRRVGVSHDDVEIIQDEVLFRAGMCCSPAPVAVASPAISVSRGSTVSSNEDNISRL